MKVAVQVTAREGLADPQNEAVRETLRRLGFSEIENCRIGRWIVLDLNCKTPEAALSKAREMCDRLLINPIMEDAQLSILEET